MSTDIDNLETSLGEFNKNYVKLSKLAKKSASKEDRKSPEYQIITATLHSLDAVLDDIVTSLKRIDARTQKS